ncbi:MAG: helix-turn-helix domain containing protein [Candidatus Cloacimonetes bacterium]|nr:helix-turn-helix domain containing protein [Candidatus Cloacimonadota bacterium]
MDTEHNAEERLLTAAIEVFCNRGYDGARTQEIADLAGISKASLHYYFRSKELLFRKAVQKVFSLIIGNVARRISEESSFEVVIRQLVEGYFEMFIHFRTQAVFFFTEMMKHEELLDEIVKGIDRSVLLNGLMLRFQKEREEGKIIDMEPVDLLVNIIAMCGYPILAEPLLKRVLTLSNDEYQTMLNRRKEMVVDFVLRAILKEKE